MARIRWLSAGAMLGLTLLSKYTAVFLGLGVLIFLVVTRDRRRWLRRLDPYLAVVVALICFTPVLLWNAQHRWISLRWQGGRGTAYHGLHLDPEQHWKYWRTADRNPAVDLAAVARRTVPRVARARRRATGAPLPPVHRLAAGRSLYRRLGLRQHRRSFPLGCRWLLPRCSSVSAPRSKRWVASLHMAKLTGLATMKLASLGFIAFLVIQSVSGMFSTGYGGLSRWLAHNDGTIELMDFGALVPAFRERGLLSRPGLFVFADQWYLAGKIDYRLPGRDAVPALQFRGSPGSMLFFESPEPSIGQDPRVTQRKIA